MFCSLLRSELPGPQHALGGLLHSIWLFHLILCLIQVFACRVTDVQADSLEDPTYFKIHIKCSKTDSFPTGCNIYISQGSNIICPVVAMGNFWLCVALPLGQCFVLQLVIP